MLIGAGIGAIILGTIGGFVAYHLSEYWNIPKGKRWKYVLGGVLIGAVVGALIGGAVGYVIGPSEQFARSADGTVHVFLNIKGIRFDSIFLTVEYWILRELKVNMVFH